MHRAGRRKRPLPGLTCLSDTGSFSHIHFVTHGTASRVAPLESSIVLSPEGEDYKLYAREITSRPLHAELVTISACYGAGTRTYTGEGLVGLSWAFLRAGAHNVVAALWEVNDISTPQLMDAMYPISGTKPVPPRHCARQSLKCSFTRRLPSPLLLGSVQVLYRLLKANKSLQKNPER